MKAFFVFVAIVLACSEGSAAQTNERVQVDAGPLKLDVYVSETAQLFHIVDQISQWSEFSHEQYVSYFKSRGGGLSESDLKMLAEHAAIRKKYGWGKGPEQVFYTPLNLDEALNAGVAGGYLTTTEADIERRGVDLFSTSCRADDCGVEASRRIRPRIRTRTAEARRVREGNGAVRG